MTRLFWILIAMFPLPLVVLLVAGPPELFDRERIRAAQDVVARLNAKHIDWTGQFRHADRLYLKQLLPDVGGDYEQFGMSFVFDTSPTMPILVAESQARVPLRYRMVEACWEFPEGQTSWMPKCF